MPAKPDSKKATGAWPNFVAICTTARAEAESAKSAQRSPSSRPGLSMVESGCGALGSGGAAGSDMDDRPDLMQPDHQHGRDEPGHGDDRGAPPGSLSQPPERGGHRDERHRNQVSDERSQPGRAFIAGEPGHDETDLDKQQD